MILKEDVYLKKVVVNQFTPDNVELRLSDKPITLTPQLNEYCRAKIEKASGAKASQGILDEGNPILRYIDKDAVVAGKEISEIWRQTFVSSDDQKLNELFFFYFSVSGDEYFAFMRVVLDEGIIHSQDKSFIFKTTNNNLPSKSKAPIDSIVINLKTREYYLLEKPIKIDGAKVNYFSEQVLEIVPEASPEKVIKSLEKEAGAIAKDFTMDEFDFQTKMKSAIFSNLEEEVLDTEKIAEKVFEGNKTAKDIFLENTAGFVPERIADGNFDVESHSKKYSVQKMKLDEEVELKVPTSIMDDPSRIEIIENKDGSRNIIFKNVKEIDVK